MVSSFRSLSGIGLDDRLCHSAPVLRERQIGACHHCEMVRLCLGTAQWGSGYGITNAFGRPSIEECAAIMEVALDAGIEAVDTALSYGDAQVRLRPWAHEFAITTKVSGIDAIGQLSECLDALAVTSVDSLLLHDWDALAPDERTAAVESLGVIADRALAKRVGVSVYAERGITSAVEVFGERGVPLGVVQVPANVLDRRLDEAEVMRRYNASGTRVQVRSVFLQGLLAGPSDAALANHPDVVAFQSWCASRGMNPLAIALAHVRSLTWADDIVVGVASAGELADIVSAWNEIEPQRADTWLASLDLDLIDPRRW